MTFWVKRIGLKSGEVVTERELNRDENLFDGPAPVVGEKLTVTCRGRKFEAEVVWGDWAGRPPLAEGVVVPIRVKEI
jgi:hypothetical protein